MVSGPPLPLVGHSYLLLNTAAEDILPRLMYIFKPVLLFACSDRGLWPYN
jgi:hypothetical protein